jgi:hypothetical protein
MEGFSWPFPQEAFRPPNAWPYAVSPAPAFSFLKRDPHAPALAMNKKGTCIASKITHCVKTNTYGTKKLISKLFSTPVIFGRQRGSSVFGISNKITAGRERQERTEVTVREDREGSEIVV